MQHIHLQVVVIHPQKMQTSMIEHFSVGISMVCSQSIVKDSKYRCIASNNTNNANTDVHVVDRYRYKSRHNDNSDNLNTTNIGVEYLFNCFVKVTAL